MTREEAKEYIKSQLESYLNSITQKKGNQYICPLCHSGAKAKGTPAGSVMPDRKHYHCFSCGFHGDTIDLLGAYEGLPDDSSTRFNRAFELFGVTIGEAGSGRTSSTTHQNPSKSALEYKNTTEEQTALKTQKNDHTTHVMKCKADISKTDYFSKRGFTFEVIDRYNLGYDPAREVVVIPYDRANSYYITRSIQNKAYYKLPNEAEPLYNLQALYNKENKPVFILEGAIDALSLMEAGAEAVALNGIGYTRLVNKVKEKPPAAPLIVSLDNDKAGENAANKLYTALQELGINCIKANVSGEHKDPNEALVADKDMFLQAVQDVTEQAIQYAQEAQEAKKVEAETEREKYINEASVTAYIDEFLGQIKKSADTPAIPTNFTELDKVLDDGLYEGLYILGAISSLGKTSFVLQIADQIAQQGQDVLIFSLEMAKTELMAKSISRITFLESKDKTINTTNAKTTRGITAGKRHANYNTEEKTLINDSIMKYASYTDYLYIYEGMGDIGVEQIRQTVEKHIKATGNKPVIVIDYLQILAPYDVRATDKQNTDKAVFELKRVSRDFKIPVIGISSLNRESYYATISMKAFKESGAVEYSSDVLIGLQFANMNEDAEKITEQSITSWKRKQPRKIELKILKNRNGATGDSIFFDYYPMFKLLLRNRTKENRRHPIRTEGESGA